MEGLAGRLYAERATEEGIAALREAMQSIDEAYEREDAHALLQAKNRFYDVLLRGCGNTAIAPLLSSLHDRVAFLRSLSLSQPGRPAKSVEEIRQILSAIEQHDPEKAATVCREHVENAAKAAFAGLAHQQHGE